MISYILVDIMISLPGNKNESLKRLNEIYKVLKKNDFGYLIEENTFFKDFPFLKNKEKDEAIRTLDDSNPVRVRKVFEELGPAYIKLGQMLATRPDLVGIKIAKELELLTDNAPITPFEEILNIIQEELGKDPMNVFESIGEVPLGSASIGQVHKGVLKGSGEEVAIKVQKPNTYEIIKSDVKIMKFLATRIDKYVSKSKIFNFPVIIYEFERSIFKEIDYLEEVLNMQHLAYNFKDDDSIHIPKVYNNLSSSRLIVMELIKGVTVSEVIKSKDDKYDKKLIASRGVNSYFKQIILDGFFHADPHSGNIFIMENNVVCFIDMGMMGNLTDDFRRNLAHLLLILNNKDIDTIINQLVYMDVIKKEQLTSELKDDLNDLFTKYYGTELGKNKGLFKNLLKTMIKHQIVLPREFVNIGRGITLIEKTGFKLDPTINPEDTIKKLSTQIVYQHYSPKNVLKEVVNYSIEFQHLLKDLPDRVNATLTKIEDGEITVKLEHQGIEKVTDKLSYSLIISALIIGSSLAILADKGPKLLGISSIGFIGFVLSMCLAIFVVLKFMSRE